MAVKVLFIQLKEIYTWNTVSSHKSKQNWNMIPFFVDNIGGFNDFGFNFKFLRINWTTNLKLSS